MCTIYIDKVHCLSVFAFLLCMHIVHITICMEICIDIILHEYYLLHYIKYYVFCVYILYIYILYITHNFK